jgi:hypothetical protein
VDESIIIGMINWTENKLTKMLLPMLKAAKQLIVLSD